MKALFLLLVLGTPAAWSSSLPLSAEILKAPELTYTHPTPGPQVVPYVAMNLKYAPAEELRLKLEQKLGLTAGLLNRGEAHITAITPPEYKILQAAPKGISFEEIDQLLKKARIQESLFEVVCLGKASVPLNGKEQFTYYIVVKSQALRKVRAAVFELYKERGGNPSLFDPDGFYGHITLGFTERDLHESDGVKKGKNSCFMDLQLH